MKNKKGFSMMGMLVALIIIGLLVTWAFKSDYFDTGKKSPNTVQQQNLMQELNTTQSPQAPGQKLLKQVKQMRQNSQSGATGAAGYFGGGYDADDAAQKRLKK